jgi:chromosome transmission fidelity protein 4
MQASFADFHGHWGVVEDLEKTKEEEETVKQQQQQTATNVNSTEELTQEEMGELFNDNYDDDDEDENSFSISRVQAEAGYAKDEDGNLVLKNGGGGAARPSSAASSTVSDIIAAAAERPRAAVVEPVRLQAAFQPGASPLHFSSRFLVYNSVGIVKAFTSESESSIDVEFHDVDVHHAFHLANPESYRLAALTRRLVVLAREGDEETPAKVCVNYFASSDMNKEWSLELPAGETILAVAG